MSSKTILLQILTALCALTFLGCGGATDTTSGTSTTSSTTTATNAFPIVDTAQTKSYNATVEMTAPTAGGDYYGQDAKYSGNPPSYTLSSDKKTVYDNVTKLTWMSSPNTTLTTPVASDKKSLAQAKAWVTTVNQMTYGGCSEWRLPTLKELYSLMNFTGTDPSGFTGTDTSTLSPFIDTTYFKFAYGNGTTERIIDSQYASSNVYVDLSGGELLLGVNFADGRIKGYGTNFMGSDKTFFVQLVRGNSYGTNSYVDNGDLTITDKATGLTWSKNDSGAGMNWKAALAWVQTKNAANYLGHNDWRLPNAKELQSIVDYTRSPSTTSSAAINDLFNCTQITDEAGAADYPYYWTGTTHAAYNDGTSSTYGTYAVYIAFGRAMGYMTDPMGANGQWSDVHGAGAQRSDPKEGDPSLFPYGNGPQGDAIRINNFVRLVRG